MKNAVLINASSLSDDALKSYDNMMLECIAVIEKFSPLAISVWTEVLRELDVRGFVRITSGSYEDIGNALIQRLW